MAVYEYDISRRLNERTIAGETLKKSLVEFPKIAFPRLCTHTYSLVLILPKNRTTIAPQINISRAV